MKSGVQHLANHPGWKTYKTAKNRREKVALKRGGLIVDKDYSDETDVLDKTLNAAEKELMHLLLKNKPETVCAAFLQHIETHLLDELIYIRTGKAEFPPSADADLARIRHRYVQFKKHPWIRAGLCPVCKHHGDDCTGNKKLPYGMAHY